MVQRVEVQIRPIRPEDAAELRQGLRRLSARTRLQRFHAPVVELTPDQWDYLTKVDGRDHVALVATLAAPWDAWRAGQIVGVARFIRDRADASIAEVAFVVYDALQRRGIGSALRDALLAAAWRLGVRAFRAHTLYENHAVRRLLSEPALVPAGHHDGALLLRIVPSAEHPDTVPGP